MRGLILAATALVLAGCALRPRYADFVNAETPGPTVALQLISDDVPVSGAVVELGEYRNKVTVVTDAQGGFSLPVDKKYLADNSILAVNAPKGVGRTHVVAGKLVALPFAPAMPASDSPASDADAGTP